ncbi:MAG TPA: hypothetical protein VFR96_18250 [Povalibacter sp.]|nr:hypothetical protein [Povalibacter sp.]
MQRDLTVIGNQRQGLCRRGGRHAPVRARRWIRKPLTQLSAAKNDRTRSGEMFIAADMIRMEMGVDQETDRLF